MANSPASAESTCLATFVFFSDNGDFFSFCLIVSDPVFSYSRFDYGKQRQDPHIHAVLYICFGTTINKSRLAQSREGDKTHNNELRYILTLSLSLDKQIAGVLPFLNLHFSPVSTCAIIPIKAREGKREKKGKMVSRLYEVTDIYWISCLFISTD